MKRIRYTIFHFPTGDFKGVERYLNEQAAKGWELEKAGLLLGKWRSTERTDLTWCVDLAKPRQERKDREEYLNLCAEGGWTLAAMINKMYLFKSVEGRNPVPVQTDPNLEKKNYNRYYIKELILDVVVLLAFFGFFALLFQADNFDWAASFRVLRYSWFDNWGIAALLIALPVWGLCALWKLVSFVAAQVRNRGGQIAVPSRWMLWADCGAGAAMWVMLLLLLVGVALDMILTGSNNVALYALLGIYGLYALYRACVVERELFPHERRRIVTAGVVLLALLAGLIAAAVNSPYKTWSSYTGFGDGDAEEALARYAQTEDIPLVRTEDLGLPLQEPGSDGEGFFDLTHTVTPMGHSWEVENYYWGSGLTMTGCETYLCFSEWQARLVVQGKLEEIVWWADRNHRMEASSLTVLTAPPAADMAPISLEWADEAWYGEWRGTDGESMESILVLRQGNLVARLSAPIPLMTEELLPVIQNRLGL